MQKEWIDTTEACFLTTKSSATIKRYISSSKSNSKAIKKQNGSTFINSSLLREKYPFINESHISPNETYEQGKEIASLTLEKQNKDIIKELILQKDSKKIPILRHSTFWTAIVSIVIIICLLGTAWLYRKELMNNNKSRINDLKQGYGIQIQDQKTELANQQTKNKELKNQYSMMISEIKSSYQKLTAIQEKQIAELTNKLNGTGKVQKGTKAGVQPSKVKEANSPL